MTPPGPEAILVHAPVSTAATTEQGMHGEPEASSAAGTMEIGHLETFGPRGNHPALIMPDSISGTARSLPPFTSVLFPTAWMTLIPYHSLTALQPLTPNALPDNVSVDRLTAHIASQPASIPPILNDRLAALANIGWTSQRSFSCFQDLPTELRLLIWRHSLEQPRQIRIRTPKRALEPMGISTDVKHAFKDKNTLGNIVSGLTYSINPGVGEAWGSRRLPSALMAVNVEARQAALEFYYIQVPAAGRTRHRKPGATIYLNPDWDYVRFFSKAPTDILDFLWDMRAYDPKGRGIKHWVVSYYDLFILNRRNLSWLGVITAQPSPFFFDRLTNPVTDWRCPDKAEMGSLLANLESLMITHRDVDRSRLAPKSHLERLSQRHELLPVNARPQSFDFLDSDPRPGLSDALTTLWVKENPVEARKAFEALLSSFRVVRGPRTKICHMVSVRPVWNKSDGCEENWVSDRDDFVDLLQSDSAASTPAETDNSEDETLLGDSSELFIQPTVDAQWDDNMGGATAEQRESNERMGLPPTCVPDAPPVERVAGFWLFPTEDFGEPKERAGDMTRWNLSNARPRLGVYRLPSTARVK